MNTSIKEMWYEVRYLLMAWPILWLLWQYALVYQCYNRARYWTFWLWIPLGLAFVVQNVIFNATVGTLIFWERPRQWFFSDRLRALPKEERVRYQRLLNAHDPNHI